MKIAIIGATGYAGSKILEEALKRGHKVTAIARHTDKLPEHENLTAVVADANNPDELAKVLSGHEAVISAVRYNEVEGRKHLETAKKAGVKRFLVSGSAASLEVAPGKLYLDAPDFPAEYLVAAAAGVDFYDVIKDEKDLDWSYLAPSKEFVPGDATGNYRIGHDQILLDENGRSWITLGDLAVEMLNETENPQHIRERITVGY